MEEETKTAELATGREDTATGRPGTGVKENREKGRKGKVELGRIFGICGV